MSRIQPRINVEAPTQDRLIALGQGLPPIPERLLLAHARGEVLFICGAGVSRASGFPDFRELVLRVYGRLDSVVCEILRTLPPNVCDERGISYSNLNEYQRAEVNRFIAGEYDVVLGMLERRVDGQASGDSRVRREVANILRPEGITPAPIHRALMRLADRGGAQTIITTNFDLMLEAAAGRRRPPTQTYALGSIPRPSRKSEFSGVFHIHGAVDKNRSRISDLVLTDQDFGEFYLRRRVVPDFIYDAARLYHLVLVGYSVSDPPMHYLLNAVAADGTRFDDLKERFTFVGNREPDAVAMADWKARGITPIHYNSTKEHCRLRAVLERWAELSPITGSTKKIKAEIRRIVKNKRDDSSESDRDLFDHFFRRGNPSEIVELAAIASEANADLGWLDSIINISTKRRVGG